jgi:predicted Zn finger-like uncharacterized protein
MQVTCPNCRARYAVDPLAIGPAGRTVQCARCNDRWFQTVKLEPTAASSGTGATASVPPPPPPDIPRTVSPFAPEAMAENDPRTMEPTIPVRPSFGRAGDERPSSERQSSERSFIDTMPIPDVVIRPTMKGSGLPALIEPKADRRLGIILSAILILLVVAAAALYYFRQDVIPLLPAEWRSMLRLN